MPYSDPKKQRAYDTAYKKWKYASNPVYRAAVIRRVEQYRNLNQKTIRAKKRESWKRNKNRYQAAKRLKRCGITQEQWDAAKMAIGNCCAICGVSEQKTRLVPDHNHDTGKFRDPLCDKCNRAIGFLKDSALLCFCAGNYLERHNG